MSNDSISYYFIKEQDVAKENVLEFKANNKELIEELEKAEFKVANCET